MGLRMDNLHAPTVQSGPTSNGYSSLDQGRKSLFELMNERDRIYAELSALSAVLLSVSPPLFCHLYGTLTPTSTMSTCKRRF